jgi:predicted HicB family RNase H-like nuclease
MKKPISARIEESIIAEAKKQAEKENRSFNNLLEEALKSYCKRSGR